MHFSCHSDMVMADEIFIITESLSLQGTSPFTKDKLLSQMEVETFESTLTLVKSLPFGKFPNISLSTDEGNVVD